MKPITYSLITGGSQGIGKALAEACARRGLNVAIVALDNEVLWQTVSDIAAAFPVQVKGLGVDLTRPDAGLLILDWLDREGMAVDVLINNAGIGFQGYFSESKLAEQELMIQLNVLSTLRLSHFLIPRLCVHPRAYLLNVASMAAMHPMPYKSVYAASKTFVRNFSVGLRGEYYGSNLSVSVLCPGPVPTNEVVRERIKKQPFLIRRASFEPEEVAEIALAGLLAGKAEIIPGLIHRLYRSVFLKLVPPGFIQYLIRRTLKKTH